jgi:5'-3' exonuclease
MTPGVREIIHPRVQVHLVDGTYELFRCFYGAPPRASADGREVGAVSGLVATLLSLLKEATHVAVAFDTVIESFRKELFAGYNTRALGLVTWSMIQLEADDALASGAARYAAVAERIVICSPDKDLCQCVRDPKVVLHDRRQKKTYDEAGVRTRLGVPPHLVPDFLALVGDTADGIPGLPGFGEKSAAALLCAHGHLEDIPDDEKQWTVKIRGAEKLAATLRAHRDEAALYRTLATLRTDADIPDDVDALRWRGPDEPRLSALAAHLRDDRLVQRVSDVQASTAAMRAL